MRDPDDGGAAVDADTIAAEPPASTSGAGKVALGAAQALDGGFERYETRGALGVGGMGEVLRCTDARIGRDVAMKVVRDASPTHELRRRFEREARIQGQLEHPSIVPVYDLGNRPDGVAYFTMKRVRGRTLAEIIRGLRNGDPSMEAAFSRRRLLGAFGTACLAVAYANSRGVVHRDLKPANIILGDFGEVYVLDWGVAKVLGEAEESFFDSGATPSDHATQVGALLGTPGYMAPEQIDSPKDVDARTDVYALGVILFELLTLDRLHRGDTVDEVLSATRTSQAARPARRAPDRDIPPELDELCARATAPVPGERLPDALELHRLLEAYLAGDRDAQQRHALAQHHVASAEQLLAAGERDPEHDIEARTEAIRELIAAMSLERDNGAAHQVMIRALTEVSPTLPRAARAELLDLRSRQRRRSARNATLGLCSLFGLVPLVLWSGIRDAGAIAWMAGLLCVSVAGSFAISRARNIPPTYYLGLMLSLGLFIASTTALFGPFFVTPSLALACAAALIAGARMPMGWRAAVIAIAIAGALVPAAIEWVAGSLPYAAAADGGMTVAGRALDLSSDSIAMVLAVMTAASILLPCMLIGRSVDVLHRAEERLFTQAWRLRKIFPDQLEARLADDAG